MDKTFEILELLPEGKSNAVSAETLTRILHLRNKRELQKRIEQERKAGALILSSTTGGYYTSHNRAEVQEFCRTLESRARHTFLALRAARRFLRETAISQAEADGQISMEASDNHSHDERE